MTSSQKQFITDSQDTKLIEEKTAPIDVVNMILKYNDFDEESGHGSVALVPTLFNSIKSQKSVRLKHLLTAIANSNLKRQRITSLDNFQSVTDCLGLA